MKYCIIDIGSNSVRLATIKDGKTLYKKVIITHLAENLGERRFLSNNAIFRTIEGIGSLFDLAKKEEPNSINIFATAAVRLANNGSDFCQIIKDKYGVEVDVVSGELEAKLGVMGAVDETANAGLIDIGGASTEIVVLDGKDVYTNSFPVGANTYTEILKDKNKSNYLNDIFVNLPKRDGYKFYGIGGTILTAVAIKLGLKIYQPELVDGYKLNKIDVEKIKCELSRLTVEEIGKLDGVQKGREKVIFAGVKILSYLLEKLGLEEIIASEKDNLEGYYKYILEKK